MIQSKQTKKSLRGAVFCCLLAIIGLLGGAFLPLFQSDAVFAEPVVENVTDNDVDDVNNVGNTNKNENATDAAATDAENNRNTTNEEGEDGCRIGLGFIAWLGCGLMEKTADAVDAIYGVIEKFLTVNPIMMDEEAPIYKIWKYFLGLANIAFIIFLLVVIYSQITGLGITNYGIKKALPKIIVTAILANLSFLICSLAVDVSNVVGNSLTGVFTAIKESSIAYGDMNMTMSSLYEGLVAGTVAAGTALGGAIAFELGAIWGLITVLLGAIVSVVVGFFTIALRQAVVILLVMIAPVAIVAQILPNTEQWFRKWKQYFEKMLVFYPMFSLLFGASKLAGFAIMASMSSIWGLLLGMAVQICPLFMAVKLMKMSGTFMGAVGAKVQSLFNKPLAYNKAWADSHKMLSRQKHLALPVQQRWRFTAKGLQKLEDRKHSRMLDTVAYTEALKKRGAAYNANSIFDKDGNVNNKAKQFYALQRIGMDNQQAVDKRIGVMNSGLAGMGRSAAENVELAEMDKQMARSADLLHAQRALNAKIEYDNSRGRSRRFREINYAHLDDVNKNNPQHRKHVYEEFGNFANAKLYYDDIKSLMGGDDEVKFAIADADQGFAAQAAVVQRKFETSADLTPATQDVHNNLMEMVKSPNSNTKYIDSIIGGMRILNKRGDTNIVKKVLDEMLIAEDGGKKMQLGTYASQSVAKFLMFDVKDSDPFLRRYGKYINLETAHAFNEMDPSKRRRNLNITFDEYVNGEYEDYDVNGNIVTVKPKRDIGVLLEGTSFKGIERTAMSNMLEGVRNASYDKNGNFDMKKFKENQEKIWKAIMPNVISGQFSFESGSEQIKSVAKAVTGMDGNEVDWKGIFGDELKDQLTEEQKKDYLDFLCKRTNSFMGGHVVSQAEKTKTDMLNSVLSLFKKKAEDEEPGLMDEYYEKKADDKLAKSFNPEVLDGLAIRYHKGFQGDTKARLAEHLRLNERYEGARRRRKMRNDDGNDGTLDIDMEMTGGGDVDMAQRLADLQEIFNENNVGANDQAAIRSFWSGIKGRGILKNAGVNAVVRIQEIERLVNSGGYTNTSDLLSDIENLLSTF